jgi:hypothetical protein
VGIIVPESIVGVTEGVSLTDTVGSGDGVNVGARVSDGVDVSSCPGLADRVADGSGVALSVGACVPVKVGLAVSTAKVSVKVGGGEVALGIGVRDLVGEAGGRVRVGVGVGAGVPSTTSEGVGVSVTRVAVAVGECGAEVGLGISVCSKPTNAIKSAALRRPSALTSLKAQSPLANSAFTVASRSAALTVPSQLESPGID